MAALGEILASLAIGLLNWWMAREDLKKTERQRLVLTQLGLESAALAWLADAQRDPARHADLRVREPERRITGVSLDPDPARPPAKREL